jgi:hypothetical protein
MEPKTQLAGESLESVFGMGVVPSTFLPRALSFRGGPLGASFQPSGLG